MVFNVRSILLVAALLAATSNGFKVCGYYCGPNWCSNEVISEQQCVATGIWGISPQSGNCADSCCRVHDDCCGEGVNRPACNDAIVSCIQSNRCYFSVCGALVWAAMKVVSDWCCGSPCPTYFLATPEQPEMTIAGKTFCDRDSDLRISAVDSERLIVTAPSSGISCDPVAYALNQTTNEVQFTRSTCHAKAFGDHATGTSDEAIITYLPFTDTVAFVTGRSTSLVKC
ncbi:GPI-anchored surface protein, putative [Bodo saltans]|uniref:GPI-anchored surface protein, putative n=1 Tax=Bodo saltans TaxID=75058 RepID=A0A0S4JU29_BODSA|nr:GPI-anchored surface protein, putative [Bodo saltans]|eukprot:CUG92620.1 GPI-anchored surface protein, putative [Bodo saltans]